jgi:hypothetical protein
MKILNIAVLILILTTSLSCQAFAEESGRTARIIEIEGAVEVKPVGGSWVPATVGMILGQRDIIKTGEDSIASLDLDGKGETAIVEVSENSQLMMAELVGDKKAGTQKTLLDLAIGKILIRAKKLHTEEEKFEVKTPTTIVGVRGTTFAVEVESME